MAPLIVLLVTTAGLRTAGAAGARRLASWSVALRGGLAAMFAVTGVSHFVGMREDMIAMVPPSLPAPGLLVTVTGVLELAGALGLMRHTTARHSAAGLSLLLIAMFPANVHAAATAASIGGSPAMPLPARGLLQLIFLAATTAVAVDGLRRYRHGRPLPRSAAR